MIVEFEGERHEFPDDASQEDIAKALSGHSKQPMSQVTAALYGARSGISAGFSDEIEGARKASGIPAALESAAPGNYGRAVRGVVQSLPYEPAIEAAYGAARYGLDRLTGQPGQATQDYESARDAERAGQKSAQEEFPKTYMAGEIGGALALPVGAGAKGAALPARAARAAGVGAGIGALTGVGESEGGVADTLTQAGIRAVAGGGLGAAGVPIAEGVARAVAPLAPAISRVASRVTAPLRAAFSPRDEAARQIVAARQAGERADPNALTRLTEQEFTAARDAGLPVTAADLGGAPVRRLADTAAIVSPEGGVELTTMLQQRASERRGRISDWLSRTFNYPDAAAQQEAITQAAGAANKPAYARAMSDAAKAHPRGLWDESFEQLAQDPTVQAAIRKANVTSRSAAARQGISEGQPITPVRSPFVMDANGRMVLRVDQNGNAARPTLQFWDEVKKNLDKTGSFEARSMARVLRDHIDETVPSYKAARSGASHFFGAENALEAGQNFVGASDKYGLPSARKALSQMSQQERQLFQDGYVSRLIEMIEAKGDKRTILNRIAESRPAQEELRMALGPRRAAELEARMRVEEMMDLVNSAVRGNSWTARRLFDIGLGTTGIGIGGWGGADLDPKKATVGAFMTALAGGRARINQNVLRHIAQMLASDDLGQLAKGVKIVANNGRLLEALRATDRRLAAISGEQAANLPAIQAGGVSGAQPNQNQVPRPPGQ